MKSEKLFSFDNFMLPGFRLPSFASSKHSSCHHCHDVGRELKTHVLAFLIFTNQTACWMTICSPILKYGHPFYLSKFKAVNLDVRKCWWRSNWTYLHDDRAHSTSQGFNPRLSKSEIHAVARSCASLIMKPLLCAMSSPSFEGAQPAFKANIFKKFSAIVVVYSDFVLAIKSSPTSLCQIPFALV